MANDWIAEGFLQLRLGMLWAEYADRLSEADSGEGSLRVLAEQVRRDVCDRFLAPAWLPGASEVVERLRATASKGRDPAALQTWFDGLAETWARNWPGDLAEADRTDLTASRKAIRHYLRDCLKQTPPGGATVEMAAPAGCADPALEPLAFPERVAAWIEQALALDVWYGEVAARPAPRRGSIPDVPWSEYEAECEQVGKALATVPRQQKRFSLRQMFHDPKDGTALLDQTIDLLNRCRDACARMAEAARPGVDGIVGDQLADLQARIVGVLNHSSESWPPQRLAVLQQELRREDAGRFGRWLFDLQKAGAAADYWPMWGDELRRAAPRASGSALARVVLLRAVVESLGVGPGIVELARVLSTGTGLGVELVTADAGPPSDHFRERVADPAIKAIHLERVGLAVCPEGAAPFAFPPARLRVPTIPAELAAWFRLPPPPSFPAADGAPPSIAPPLAQWHEESRQLVGAPAEVPARVRQARQQFGDWLQRVGGEWFHRLARQAARPEASNAARDWLTTLVEQGWCHCYPVVSKTGQTSWPVDGGMRPPAVRREFADAAPGTVLAVERFAATPDAARCTLSLGPRQPGSPLDAAYRLSEVVRATSWLGEALGSAAETLWTQTLDPPPEAGPSATEAPMLAVLDGMLQAVAQATHGTEAALNFRKLPAAQAQALDAALAALRDWGRPHHLDVLPRAWSFRQPLALPQLGADENGATLLFRSDVPPRGVHRVRTFGLVRGAVVVRPCVLSASAGPPPAGFTELEELVRRPAHADEEKILQRLRGWREARLEGTFDLVAVQFFVDFWGELGDGLRRGEPDKARTLSERLALLLHQELRLEAFYPTLYQDHPDGWLQLARSRPITTGRVLQVLRPGLRDEQGLLRVPALVNVE